jgi:hypothetical protein
MRPIALLMTLATAAALAACGSGAARPEAGPPGTTQAGTPDAQTAAIVQCYRAHGDPSFPDPVYDPSDGRWHFAVSPATAPQGTRQACQHLFPSAQVSPPVPQAQFAQLVRFADCMRRHGEPTWPDPRPDGAFALPPSLMGKGDPVGEHAFSACQRDLASGHYDVVAASS